MDIKETITYRRILIINLGGMGDLLLSIPALKALRNHHPLAEISILIVSRVYESIKDLPYIDNVFFFHKKYFPVGFLKNVRSLLILRKKRFDLAINMRTIHSKSSAGKIKLLLDIINPKIKAGRDTEGRGYFFDLKIPENNRARKYEMEYDIDTVEALGVDVTDRNVNFEIDDKDVEKVSKILKSEGISKTDIIISIHPGGMPSRRWPIDDFSKVINEIYRKISCKFVVTGEKREFGLANKLLKLTNAKMTNLAGRLDIKELGALIKTCNLYISNDTGPMHIAAILKTPLVAIFGPECLARYDPRNISDKAVVLYKKVDCSPCNRVKCKSMRCLRAISPEEVVEKIWELLDTSQKGGYEIRGC